MDENKVDVIETETKAYKTKFKKWCVESGMQASDIAEQIGCSKKSVYAYMQGYRLPSRKVERAMREKFAIDTNEIFN